MIVGSRVRRGVGVLAFLVAPALAWGQSDLLTKPFVAPPGAVGLRLADVSLDILSAGGASTERDASLENLQGGGHDPRKRGFTIQNIELSLTGAVDPYLNTEAHIIYFLSPIEGETVVELEEAFATTRTLPYGLQLEVGQFFTEFGRLNPQHPHQWRWQDQPVINTRLFGPDGMRGPGVRCGWLTPLPWFSELHAGAQNANGETMASFLANDEFFAERPIGQRLFVERDIRKVRELVYLVRLDNGFDLSDSTTAKLGVSCVNGPNATGLHADTTILGADLFVKWRPEDHKRGWPFVEWQTEVMTRMYQAAEQVDPGVDPVDPSDDTPIPHDDLEDWGVYSQLLYGFAPRWAAGFRYDYATGSGASFGGRDEDPFRDDRTRYSPLLSWFPTEFSRLRLQYNYDHAPHLRDGSTHSVWIGVEIFIGAHPAHKL
ncbi:MAG: TonB-dependent receptor [Planctomycetes bacterium]|nr:TonB-dependent receptor [Planctomycetota bacterium]